MSTNYYLRYNICDKCGKYDDEIHLGGYTAGYNFNLKLNDWYSSWKEMKDWLKLKEKEGYLIFDEYGKNISFTKFVSIVEEYSNMYNLMDGDECNYYYDEEGYKFIEVDFS